MNITLQQIRLENFKGIHCFEATFDGQNARIHAENGVGKTTLYDGWLWLLFGKDSTGRTDSGRGAFNLHPLDKNDVPIKGLVTAVEGEVGINGVNHLLRKESHEKVVKDQTKGYETYCWIDEVSKKVGEFEDYIDSIISEDTFKMLCDLSYFNAKLHHTERRKMLVALAGKVSNPKGFDNLLAVLNGRSIKDYETVLKERKARYVAERDEINPRIDEIRRAMNGYAEQETSKLQVKRQNITQTIQSLNSDRNILLGQEKDRQNQLEQINQLTVQRLHRQSQLRSDASQTQKLLDEKANLQSEVAGKEEAVNALHRQVKSIDASIESAKTDLSLSQQTIDRVRGEIEALDKANVAEVCFNCAQTLPMAMVAKSEAKRQSQKRLLVTKAQSCKESIDDGTNQIAQLQQQRKSLSDKAGQLYKDFQELAAAASKRKSEIDAAIQNRPEPEYSKDAEYRRLSAEIDKLQAQVGESVAVQLEAIENRKNEAQRERDAVNAALVQSDRAKLDKARIAELEAKEKELAQKIAECDRQLADLADYKAAQSRLIETAVNGLFSHVQFKLFDYRLNGTIDETCEAMLNGVPYLDMSTGQQILAGVDVINVLSDHYGLSVPLFVDHAESLTLPLEAKSQVIELYAEKGVNELVVEVEEKAAVAA